MEDWVDDAAAMLDRATRDPMEGAYRGTLRILAASAPVGRGRYQECALELLGEAPGVEPRTISTALVFSTRAWPAPGLTVTARFSRVDPTMFEADWDALGR